MTGQEECEQIALEALAAMVVKAFDAWVAADQGGDPVKAIELDRQAYEFAKGVLGQ